MPKKYTRLELSDNYIAPEPRNTHMGRKACVAVGSLVLPLVVMFGFEHSDHVESTVYAVWDMVDGDNATVPTSYTSE